MKYKVGDKVKLKSKEGLDELKRQVGDLYIHPDAYKNAGSEQTILECKEGLYRYDASSRFWHDSLFEGLVEESDDLEKMYMESEKRYEEEYSKGEYCHEQSFKWGFQEGCDYAHENEKLEINLKNGYQFVDENGNVINATKIVLEKKKPKYPKTYDDCVIYDREGSSYNRSIKLSKLEKLLICRDAYWKIAGEEMGLGKSWEPGNNKVFGIIRQYDKIQKYNDFVGGSTILEFPTAEMRDAFKENFDPDIEVCKEFL